MPETTPDVPPVDLTAEEREALRGLGQGQYVAAVARIVAARLAAERAEWAGRVEALAAEFEGYAADMLSLNRPESAVVSTVLLGAYGDFSMRLRALAQPAATEPGTAGERARCRHFLNGWTCADEARGRSGWDDWCEPCLAASPSAPAAPSVPTEDTAAKEGEQ